jgi:hypothetical protein
MRQGEALAERIDRENLKAPAARIARAYQLLYQRQPAEPELQRGLRYLSSGGDGAWPRYAQVLLATNEFLYLE